MTKTQQSKRARGRPITTDRERVHVYLDRKHDKKLRAMAKAEDRSFTYIINKVIEAGLRVG